MNSRMKSMVASTLISLGSLVAANTASAAIELSPQLPISGILTNPQGGFLMLLTASNPACGSSGNQFNVTIGAAGMTAEGAKSALAAALTAYALGKPVRVYFDPALPGCPVQMVWIEP